MEKTKKATVWYLLIIFSILISILALILAFAKLDCSLNELDASFDRAITIVEMIIGALSLCATIYFVTMGITLHDYKRKLDKLLAIAEETHSTMRLQLKETIAVFFAIESIAGEQEIYIRLAKGKLLCQSKYSDNEEKIQGIRYIQAYYMTAGKGQTISSEDYEILYQLKNNPELDDEVRDCAETALNAIQNVTKQNSTPNKTTKDPSNLISKLMNFMRNMVSKILRDRKRQQ